MHREACDDGRRRSAGKVRLDGSEEAEKPRTVWAPTSESKLNASTPIAAPLLYYSPDSQHRSAFHHARHELKLFQLAIVHIFDS